MAFRVVIPKAVAKQLDRLPNKIADAIFAALEALEKNPRPAGCKKLKGRDGWRVRVGDYRIIYEIRDKELLILVITIAHRREVYRQ